MLAVSLVIARLVVEQSSPMPAIENDAVLLIKRHGVSIGCPPDTTGDAGVGDGGTGEGGPGDAGVPDAGVPSDGGVPPPTCERIEGDAITMVVRPQFTANITGAKFAVLFVTPERPILETVPDQFVELAELTAPKTEFEEIEVPDYGAGTVCTNNSGGCGSTPPQQESSGCGAGFNDDYGTYDPPNVGDGGVNGDGLEHVGPYEVLRMQPADKTELAALLDSFGYLYAQDDLDAVAPYLAKNYTVVAVRVRLEPGTSVPGGRAMTPIAMTWPGAELRVPIALGGDSLDVLRVFIAADGRYDLPGAEVPFAERTYGGETNFLTLNKLKAVSGGSPDDDPVAEHVLYDPEYHETHVVETEVRVPVMSYCDDDQDAGCCRECNAPGRGVRIDWAVVGFVVVLVLRRRRRGQQS